MLVKSPTVIAPCETSVPPSQASAGSSTPPSSKHTISEQTEDCHVPAPARAAEKDAGRNSLFAREGEDVVDAVAKLDLFLGVGVESLDCSKSGKGFLGYLGHFTYRFLGLVG